MYCLKSADSSVAQLKAAAEQLPTLSERLLAVLAEEAADAETSQAARDAITALKAQWGKLAALAQAQDQQPGAIGQPGPGPGP